MFCYVLLKDDTGLPISR